MKYILVLLLLTPQLLVAQVIDLLHWQAQATTIGPHQLDKLEVYLVGNEPKEAVNMLRLQGFTGKPKSLRKFMPHAEDEPVLVLVNATHPDASINFGIDRNELLLLDFILGHEHDVYVLLLGHPEVVDFLPHLYHTEAVAIASADVVAQELGVQAFFGAALFQPNPAYATELHKRMPYWAPKPETPAVAPPLLPVLHYVRTAELVKQPQRLIARIDSIMAEAIAARAFPGCQVLAAKGDSVFFYKAYGHHTYDSTRLVSRADYYDLASLTKVLGPLPLLMQRYQQGQLQLTDPLQRHVPFLRRSNKADITLKEVLAHQGGLKAWIPFWQQFVDDKGQYKRKLVRTAPSEKFAVQVAPNLYISNKRTQKTLFKTIRKSAVADSASYQYSDLFFHLSPFILSCMGSEPYEQQLQQFYKPMGINLRYRPAQQLPLQRIVPTEYDSTFRRQLVHGTVHDEGAALFGGVSGNAGLFGTAADVAKVFSLYLKGSYGGSQPFQPQTLATFTSRAYPGSDNRRALGFDKTLLENPESGSVAVAASEASFGHSGFTGTLAWADPENDLIFVFLSNRVYPSREQKEIYRLNIRPRIHQAIYEAL